jgi:hypothetical protein
MDQKRLWELALEGLKAQKERIELELRALTRGVGAAAAKLGGEAPVRKRRPRTAAQRKAQAARMKAYWAEKKKKAAKKPKAQAKSGRKASKRSGRSSRPGAAQAKDVPF